MPYVLIHIHNFVEILNYSLKKITLQRQIIFHHEPGLLVKG